MRLPEALHDTEQILKICEAPLARRRELAADLAAASGVDRRAPTRLKSRIYSALMRAAAASGPLRPLGACEQAGRALCVWETLARTASSGSLDEFNYCRVCHARVLGERIERAPLAWRGCPYADFQKT